MENLLPAVANIDVTSNDFREAALPYQQWEVSYDASQATISSYS